MSMMNANAAATTAMTANEPLDFVLPEMGDADFSSEELAEDADGLTMSFPRIKMPRICSSFSGSLSRIFKVSGPNVATISSAVLGPMPLISPDPKYASRPSAVCGTISCHCSTCS